MNGRAFRYLGQSMTSLNADSMEDIPVLFLTENSVTTLIESAICRLLLE